MYVPQALDCIPKGQYQLNDHCLMYDFYFFLTLTLYMLVPQEHKSGKRKPVDSLTEGIIFFSSKV